MKRSDLQQHLRQHSSVYGGIFVLVLGVLFFHWRGLAPGQVFLPVDLANRLLPWREAGAGGPLQNWLISDPLYQFYPFLIQSVASLRQGELLLWNPALFSGHPALADPLFQTFYPFVTLFALVFGPARGFSLALVAHALAAALLMFGFLRSLRLGVPAAVLGGFTYALSGYLVTWFEFPFWITTLAWLPGILWAYHAGVARGQWRYASLAGLLFGLALLAGQYQFLVVFALFWMAYAAAVAFARRRAGGSPAFPLLSLLAALTIGSLIGALQALPFAELLAVSRRALESAPPALPLSQLVTLLLPNFYGNPALAENYWGYGNYNEHTIYVGIVALFLAWLALFARPRALTVFLVTAVLAVLWFAAGGPGAALVGALPPLRQVAPHRVVFLLPLLLGWLAAATLDRPALSWRSVLSGLAALLLAAAAAILTAWNAGTASAAALLRQQAGFSLFLLLVTAGLLVLRARRPRWRAACDWLVAALVFINLAWYGRGYNPAGAVAELFPPTPVTEYLQEARDILRAVSLQQGSTLLFGPNAIADYGVLQPGGYSSLVIGAYHDLVSRGDPVIEMPWIDRSSNFVLFSRPSDRLLDLLNVNLLAAPVELPDPGPVAEFEAPPCRGVIPVTDAAPLEGEFTVWRSAINRIDIPLVQTPTAAAAAADAAVRLQLWRDGPGGVPAADVTVPAAEVLALPQWTVYFAPEEDAPGRRYAWKLSAAGLGEGSLRICAGPGGGPALAVYGQRQAPVELAPDSGVHLYRRFAPFPRASIVYAAETVDNPAARLDRLFDPAFDTRNIALTEAPTALPAAPPFPATEAEIVEYGSSRVVVTAAAQADGLLVLGDQYFGGWEAAVDGVAAPILRVNHVMRGVPLSPGRHTVVFTFAPRALQLGGSLAVLGLVLAVLLASLDSSPVRARIHRHVQSAVRGKRLLVPAAPP